MLVDGAFTVLLLLVSGASAAIREFDFPPVDLNEKDSGLAFSFTHPHLFYEELKLADEATFNFTVSSDSGDFEETLRFCTAQEETCRGDIVFPEGAEKCVTLNGSLFGGKVMFRETGRICLSIPPPTNVTLSCQNVNVVVGWEFGQRRPRTSFRVHIGGSTGHHMRETTDHQYNLSNFIWWSEERYMGFHYVTVTAVDGGNQSEPVASKTFTFNSMKLAHIKCELDFPPVVDLNEKDFGATLSFVNPLHYYGELKRAVKANTATFQFTATVISDSQGSCTARQDVCKHDIVFPEGAEKCIVALKGLLYDGSGVGQVDFRETGRICISKSPEVHVLALTIMLFILVITISVTTIIICKVKAWTMKIPGQPNALIPEPHRDGVLRYAPVSPADISAVSLPDANKLRKNPSVSSEEEEEEEVGFYVQPLGESYVEGELPEGYRRDDDSSDNSGETVLIHLEEEEEEEEEEVVVSPYDCPHMLQVEMGDGDMVTGYSER